MAVDLSIVIVSWNVVDLLRDCLRSILAAPTTRLSDAGAIHIDGYSVEVYVVDNASSDSSAEMVSSSFPQVKLIASRTNLGFAGGSNLALGHCHGRYVLLLNPDTQVLGDALSIMVKHMERKSDVGVVGPRLYYADGRPQPSRRRFPTLMTAFMESTLLQHWFPRNRWALQYYMADLPDDIAQDVDWVIGACMLVRAEAIERVGPLDQAFFMYSEEMDWCRRIADDGWRVVYLPRAEIIHHEGRSSDQVVPARHIRFQTSKIRYFRKHHGAPQATVLRLFILLTYLVQLAEETLKYLVGHKRALRRERIAAYIQVLGSGLRTARTDTNVNPSPCSPPRRRGGDGGGVDLRRDNHKEGAKTNCG